MSSACRPNFADGAYAIKMVEQAYFRLFFAVSAVHANTELCGYAISCKFGLRRRWHIKKKMLSFLLTLYTSSCIFVYHY